MRGLLFRIIVLLLCLKTVELHCSLSMDVTKYIQLFNLMVNIYFYIQCIGVYNKNNKNQVTITISFMNSSKRVEVKQKRQISELVIL